MQTLAASIASLNFTKNLQPYGYILDVYTTCNIQHTD